LIEQESKTYESPNSFIYYPVTMIYSYVQIKKLSIKKQESPPARHC